MHYSTRRHVALGLTTGGLLMTGFGMTTAQADTGATASGDTAGSPGVSPGTCSRSRSTYRSTSAATRSA